MSRYRYLLDQKIDYSDSKVFGLFPFNAVVDKTKTDISNGSLEFLPSAIDGLRLLSQKNYSVVLFINQFKSKQISFETFQSLNRAVESFFLNNGIKVAGLYWCPSIDKNDPYVVPNAGMFSKVIENIGINWENVPVISTSDADLSAAEKVNATPVKIGKGPSKWTLFEDFNAWSKTV